MKRTLLHFLLLFSVVISCNKGNKEKVIISPFLPKKVIAHGYLLSKDSIEPPKVIQVGKPEIIKAANPKVVSVPTNVHTAPIPKIVPVGIPKICTPGKDSFALPVVNKAIDSPFLAGIPEIIQVKELQIKSNNPFSFINIGKMQGLKNALIRCILQDRYHNLWFGTEGGGLYKYDGKYFTVYTEKEGLYSNNVYFIMQDKHDNIWFTSSGVGLSGPVNGVVTKFDGTYFTNYSRKNGLDDSVKEIVEDKEGNIWFGGDGLCKYNGKSFMHYYEKQGASSNDVFCITTDETGNIWAGTSTKGIFKFDGVSFTQYTSDQGLPCDKILHIKHDKNDNLWISGLWCKSAYFDKNTFQVYDNNIIYAMRSTEGNIWFGIGDTAIAKYDGINYTLYGDNEGLSIAPTYIYQDINSDIWFCSIGSGMYKYREHSYIHYTEKEGLLSSIVYGIIEDNEKNLWFASYGGAAKYVANIHDDRQRKFLWYTDSTVFKNHYIFSLFQDKSHNIWFGTIGNGAVKFDGKTYTVYTTKQGLIGNDVYSIIQDRNGDMWFATINCLSKFNGTTFTNYHVKSGINHVRTGSIIEDKNGDIWVGTNKGVNRISGSKTDNEKCIERFTSNEGLTDKTVNSIVQDKKGNIWFATKGDGVFKYDGKYFTNFTENEGLISNSINNILDDKDGNLWFGSQFGLSKLSQRSLSYLEKLENEPELCTEKLQLFKSYTYEDGFYGVGSNRNSMCQDSTGTIWIGTNDRLTSIKPSVNDDDTIPPCIQLTSVSLFDIDIFMLYNKSIIDTGYLGATKNKKFKYKYDSFSKWYNIPQNLNLAYNNNNLTFKYIGTTTNFPKKVRYRYMLEGVDENWSKLTDKTEVAYINLPNGVFTFKVKAMNGDGYWSKEFAYTFTIRPPWWKTWWAYFGYIAFALSSITFYIKWRTASLLKRQKELEDTVDERTLELVEEKKEVEKQKEEVEKQRIEAVKQYKRSEDLLLNILPIEVATELKEKGRADAKTFGNVTVMFTDFKNFTTISEKLTAQELVNEIDFCFIAIDKIIEKYNIEKIKTIGDSYMAVGGLPVTNNTHATDIVNAAIEIRDFMNDHNQKKRNEGKEVFEIRIGIHTGTVVAGIVGFKKFAYDVWGDTVNMASRMESSGEAGKINISVSTYQLVKENFNCTYRGKIEAKKKGMIDMYFVERK